MAVRAYLDRCDADIIGGWAFDDGRYGHPVEIELLLAGEVVACTVADEYRPDLVEARIGDGRCAFRISADKFPPGVRPERLVVRVKGSEVYIGAYERNRALPDSLREIFDVVPPPGFKRRPLCILHIGFEKTGSTSIQRMLQRRRVELAHCGYYVPWSLATAQADGVVNHIGLTSITVDEANFLEDFRAQFAVNDPEAIYQHRLKLISQFVDEICNTRPEDVVVLSNEHCQSRLTTFREIARLKTLLLSLFEEIRIIAFIRPQHEVAVGLYDSSLRYGMFGRDIIPQYSNPNGAGLRLVSEDYFDYCRTLDRWACVFGRPAMRPAVYKSSGSGPGILNDFASLLGLPEMTPEDLPRENRGFHPSSQAVLELFNESVYRRGIMLKQRVRDQICSALIAIQGNRPRPSSVAGARAFLERFAGSNEELRQTWFPEKEELFKLEFSEAPGDTKSRTEMRDDMIVDLLGHLARK